MERLRILIVSDDPEFVDLLVQSWLRYRCAPEFAICKPGSAELAQSAVVVADGPEALASLSGGVQQAIVVTATDELLPEAGTLERTVVRIRRTEGWAEVTAALAQETALRVDALHKVEEIEGRLRELEHLAALGRFISEARHGLGNALTSVLGNSELLLMTPQPELCDVRGQLETIHQMSLRILETLQGLSSLDAEMMRKNRGASC